MATNTDEPSFRILASSDRYEQVSILAQGDYLVLVMRYTIDQGRDTVVRERTPFLAYITRLDVSSDDTVVFYTSACRWIGQGFHYGQLYQGKLWCIVSETRNVGAIIDPRRER